jgi:hypothetical protein
LYRQLGVLHALCVARLDGCEAVARSVALTVEAHASGDALREAPLGTDRHGRVRGAAASHACHACRACCAWVWSAGAAAPAALSVLLCVCVCVSRRGGDGDE